MSTSSEDSDGSSTNSSPKRQRTLLSSSSSSKKLTATLMDLDVIDCPVCFNILTVPIFQCENGHIACSPCCQKLSNKCECATCSLAISFRSRAMERVLESLKVPCPNTKFGCSKELSYDERSAHLEQCAFTQFPCPFIGCDFTGSHDDLYEHSVPKHCKFSYMFKWGERVSMLPTLGGGERVILKEQTTEERGELVVVECFNKPYGSRILIARCIGPGTEKFSYELSLYSYSDDNLAANILSFRSSLRRVGELSNEKPKKHFMLVDSYMSYNYQICICIKREAY